MARGEIQLLLKANKQLPPGVAIDRCEEAPQ
jgi:hypothetical protein